MANSKSPRQETYRSSEADRRRDAALSAALRTPPSKLGEGPERKAKKAKPKIKRRGTKGV